MKRYSVVLTMGVILALVVLNYAFSEEMSESSANQSPPRSSQDAINQGEQMLPFREPVETVETKDGTRVNIYVNSLGGNTSGMARAYYFPIPFITADPEKFFDCDSNRVSFDLSFQYKNKEVSQLLKSEEIKKSGNSYVTELPLVQMPIRGIEVSVAVAGNSETILIDKDSTEYNVLGNITCSAVVTNPQIIETLKVNPQNVRIAVRIFCKFKEENGAEMRFAMESRFSQKIEEQIFDSTRDSILISKKGADSLLRDASNAIVANMYSSGSVVVHGKTTPEMEKFVSNFMKQNSDFFQETELSQFTEYNESVFFYTKDFALLEIKPEVVDSLIKSYSSTQESKSHIINQINQLRQIAKESTDVQDFLTKVSQSKQVAVGASYLNIGVNASYGTSNSSEKASHDAHASKVFSMLKDDNYSDEELYNRSGEAFSGDVKRFFSRPNSYSLVRVSRSDIRKLTQMCFQQTTIISYQDSVTFQTNISSAAQRKNTNERIEELEAANEEKRQKIEALEQENNENRLKILDQEATINRLNRILDITINNG